jgi:hypothetical protein
VAASGEASLRDALEALRAALDAEGVPWMCIGGLAVIARGVRRTTLDVDATIRGDAVEIEPLVQRLGGQGILPRIPDAIDFARTSLVLLLRHESTGVDVDLSLAWLQFEHEALDARTLEAIGEVTIPVARAEDLVIYKVFAARPQDLRDAEALVLLHGPALDTARIRRVIRELSALAGLDDRDELLAGVLRARRARRKRRP